jgi:hypothetical protein
LVRRGTAALLVALVLVACGGGGSGKPLTETQLVARVNTECDRLQKAATNLVNAQDPSATGSRVGTYLHRAASELRTRSEAIAALNPPTSLASQVRRFTGVLARYADGLDALADHVKPGEGYSDLLNRSTSQVDSLNRLSDQANRLAVALNFTSCGT